MASSIKTRENAIKQAIQDIYEGLYFNVAQTAAAHVISSRTLRNRLQEATSLKKRPATNKALSTTQEQVLLDYIARINQIDISSTSKILQSSVNYILRREHRRVEVN